MTPKRWRGRNRSPPGCGNSASFWPTIWAYGRLVDIPAVIPIIPPATSPAILGVRGDAESLLDAIPGAERLPLPDADQCCGFGGLFAVKQPAMSTAMMRRKLDSILATGAEACVVCDASCMTHLNGGLIAQGKPPLVKHLAEVLAE